MNERLRVSEQSVHQHQSIGAECRSKGSRAFARGAGSVQYVCPNSISGVNTFLLQTENSVVKMRFDVVRPGLGHKIHIIKTPAGFRSMLKTFGKTGCQVEVFKDDGSTFVYTYHEADVHESDI